LVLVIGLFNSSCHRPFDNTNNTLKIDTLQNMVAEIDNTLILSEDSIARRNDSMKIKLNLIQTAYKDTTNGEIRAAIIRYNGIHNNYEDFLKNYPVMEFDEDRHKKTVQDIKEKVLGREITQEEFDRVYTPEKLSLEKLLGKAKTMTYNIYAVEEDFHRNDPVVTKLYHELGGK
jgi:hypothetical protein